MQKANFLFFFCLLLSNFLGAQTLKDSISGKVEILSVSENLIKAAGAKLQWLGTSAIFYCDVNGEFRIPADTNHPYLLLSHPQAQKDTLKLEYFDKRLAIVLQQKIKKMAVVNAQRYTAKVNYLNPILTLNIGKGELLKAACCNLSESFETTPAVDVSYTDAISGQKQIQMLGLAGPYTTITQENIPNIRGLASIEGLNYTPGTWVEGMQLSKGCGSVVNGFESLAGQINVELQKPDKADPLFVNIYQSTQGRTEANVHLNKTYGNFAHGLLLHYKNQWLKQDMNKDGFFDNPLSDQKIALYRWQLFKPNGIELQGGIKGVDMRLANSNEFYRNENPGSFIPLWEFQQHSQRLESWLKLGKVYVKKPWKSMGLQLAGFVHEQATDAGIRSYFGKQQNLYANYIYQNNIANTNHQIKAGASLLYDNYTENYPDTLVRQMNRIEWVPGIFGEYTYNYLDHFTVVAGIRADYHNLYGFFATPRLHLKYSPVKGHSFRMSIGRSQRTASVVAENQKALFSGRTLVFEGDAANWQKGYTPEIAWNTGLSYVHDFELNYRKGNITFDYYYSWFAKQIIADYESLALVKFYTLAGKSYAHSAQLQVDYSPAKRFDVRLAYRMYDVKTTFQMALLEKPLISKHRAFVNVAYATKSKWKFDVTLNYTGSKRLSDGNINDGLSYSPSFFLFNGHVSKSLSKQFELYAGGENMGNYMQHHAIVGNDAPFSSNFDASQIWGPLMGANYYVGMRWSRMPKIKK